MNTVVIGNVIALVGSLLMVWIGLIKKKEHILFAQCAQFTFMGIANLVLGGMTGLISNIVSIIRNLICIRFKYTMALKLAFIAVQTVLSCWLNTNGLIGWLPVAATVLFTWFLDAKSEITIKYVMIVTLVMWLIYDLYLRNYVSAVFDAATIVSTIIGILMLRKKNEEQMP